MPHPPVFLNETQNNDFWLKPDLFMTEVSAQRILARLNTDQINVLKQLGSAEEAFKNLKQSPSKSLYSEKPFVFLYVKPQPSKKKTRQWAIIDHECNLIVYDISTKMSINYGVFNKVFTDSKRQVKFDYGAKNIRKYTVKEKLLDLSYILTNLKHEEQLPLFQRILVPYARIPAEVKPNKPDEELFTQIYSKVLEDFILSPELCFMRMFQHVPCAAQTIRNIGASIEAIYCHHHRIPYLINNLIPILFKNTPSSSQIMRGESLVTRVIACVRARLCTEYYGNLIEKIITAFDRLNTADEFIPVFFDIINDNMPPPAIRWICSVLAREIKIRFPEEPDSVYYAVSNFFFLRGLGPKFAPKNASLQMKFSFLTMLFNLHLNPVLVPFIERFKALVDTIATAPDSDIDFGTVSDSEYKSAIETLHSSFVEQTSTLCQSSEKIAFPSFEHPMLSTLRSLYTEINVHLM